MRDSLLTMMLIVCFSCRQQQTPLSQTISEVELPGKVEEIQPPPGFKRISSPDNSFTTWLRNLHFKKDKTVYLFNGEKKKNQSAQFAVIDISRSKKDLQQCADVVMRLRAEYLFANKKYDS